MVTRDEPPLVTYTAITLQFMVAVQSRAHRDIRERVKSFNRTANRMKVLLGLGILLVYLASSSCLLVLFYTGPTLLLPWLFRKWGVYAPIEFVDFHEHQADRIWLVFLSGGGINTLRVPGSRAYYQRLYLYVAANNREELDEIEDWVELGDELASLMVAQWESDHLRWLLALPPARRGGGYIYCA